MKNSQRGNTLAIVAMIVIVAITVCTFLYLHWVSGLTSERYVAQVSNQVAKIIASRESARRANPPSGFLVPNAIPAGYILKSSYFSSSTTNWKFEAQINHPQSSYTAYLTFGEVAGDQSYEDYIRTHMVDSPNGEVVRAVDNFTYKGFNGTVLGTFANARLAIATSTSMGYSLVYNDNGKLFFIDTNGDVAVTPTILINMLKSTTVAPSMYVSEFI